MKITKNAKGYGYNYADLTSVNQAIYDHGYDYWQEIVKDETGEKQIITHITKEDKVVRTVRGSYVVELSDAKGMNIAQAQGASETYARRYSLYLAFGIACEDDDAQSLNGATKKTTSTEPASDSQKSFYKTLYMTATPKAREHAKEMFAEQTNPTKVEISEAIEYLKEEKGE